MTFNGQADDNLSDGFASRDELCFTFGDCVEMLSVEQNFDDVGHFRFDQLADAASHRGDFLIDGQFGESVVLKLVDLQIDGARYELLSHRSRTLLIDLFPSESQLVDGD